MAKRSIHDFAAGDRVRFSGKFLRDTGQVAGGEGHKVFTVLDVEHIRGGSTILRVDEIREDLSYWTAEELAEEPELKYRRINAANVTRVGTLSNRDVI